MFLDAFNLLTVLYKLDTARQIVHICPAVIGRVYHRTYIIGCLHFCSLGLLGWLPSIFMFLLQCLGLAVFWNYFRMELLRLSVSLNESLHEFKVLQTLAIVYSNSSFIVPYCLTKNLIQIYSLPSREFYNILDPFTSTSGSSFGTSRSKFICVISSMLPCISMLV